MAGWRRSPAVPGGFVARCGAGTLEGIESRIPEHPVLVEPLGGPAQRADRARVVLEVVPRTTKWRRRFVPWVTRVDAWLRPGDRATGFVAQGGRAYGPGVPDSGARKRRFLVASTGRATKVALPSPFCFAQRTWDPTRSARPYPSREAFMRALVPLLAEGRPEAVLVARSVPAEIRLRSRGAPARLLQPRGSSAQGSARRPVRPQGAPLVSDVPASELRLARRAIEVKIHCSPYRFSKYRCRHTTNRGGTMAEGNYV